MTCRRISVAILVALACLAALPSSALAQSSIGGTVKDSSGGVLPGVTVDVSSPVLIEGTKSATTDGSGAYRITDLRPGMYTVKFSLTGFSTVERSAFQLLTDFNARIDAEMKVGALEETVTVTGAAPIVDVQSAVKVAVLDRQALDNIPSGKSIFALGQLILGVTLSAPDVGGSAGAMSTYMSMRGGSVSAANNTVMVDGMVINGLMLDGAVQTYVNDADFQEVSYQTAGAGADRSGGGVALNMVPKEGGNRLSGDAMLAYRPGQLQGDNYTDRLKAWGLPLDKKGKPAITRIDHIYDMSGSGGGPIQKDKLWFFVSARNQEPVNAVPNTFLNDGSQGLDDNYIRQLAVRLTYQISPRHKIGAYYERVYKWRGHDMGAFTDPETAGRIWTSPDYSTDAIKYTGTLSSKLLVEGGFSQNTEYYWNLMEGERSNPPTTQIQNLRLPSDSVYNPTSLFYTRNMSHAASSGGGANGSLSNTFRNFPVSEVIQGSVSYVTGAHHAKAGGSWKWGKYGHGNETNGDIQQVYPTFLSDSTTAYEVTFPTTTLFDTNPTAFAQYFPTLVGAAATNGAPCNRNNGTTACTVTARSTPFLSQETLNRDLGFYVQDSYTLKRLTLNAGLRYEMVNVQIDDLYHPQPDVTKPGYYSNAGRFVPNRTAPAVKNIPNWKDWAPRFQMVYDVFGNSKTAVKYSFNRYNESVTTGLAQNYNGLYATTSSRNWTDLNRDDIAQGGRTFTYNADGSVASYTDCVYLTAGCEINLSGAGTQAALNNDFGLASAVAKYKDFPRRYRLEQGFELQQAVLPRLSLSGAYYHGWNKNLTKTVNTARIDSGLAGSTTGTQYTLLNLYNPIDGTPFTYASYTGATALASAGNVTYLEPLTDSQYDTYSAEFQMRPYAGAQLGGGISIERTLTNNCQTSYQRTAADVTAYGGSVGTALVDPNSLRFCDERNLGSYPGAPAGGVSYSKPYTKGFKLSGAFPIVYGINFGVSYQNLDGGGLSPTFQYTTGNKYSDGSALYTMLGKNATSGAIGAIIPACPVAYGCVAGGASATANPNGSATGVTAALFPTGFVASERIVQLDVRASKNFRFGRYTIQPSIEAFNLMNIDEVRGRTSSQLNTASGTYMQPSTTLQGRIIGFGANFKW
jgi:hypothetical protein